MHRYHFCEACQKIHASETDPPGEFVLYSDTMAEIEKKDEVIHQLQEALQNLKIMKDKEIAELRAEVERLDYLHKLDHSLADQWQAKNERLAAVLRDDERVGGVNDLANKERGIEKYSTDYLIGRILHMDKIMREHAKHCRGTVGDDPEWEQFISFLSTENQEGTGGCKNE